MLKSHRIKLSNKDDEHQKVCSHKQLIKKKCNHKSCSCSYTPDPKAELETPIEEPQPVQDDLEEEVVCQKATTERTCNHGSCSCSYKPDSKDSEGVDQPTVWCPLFGQESDLNGPSTDGKTIGCETEDKSVKLLSAELMKCHVHFGHASFQRL